MKSGEDFIGRECKTNIVCLNKLNLRKILENLKHIKMCIQQYLEFNQ